MVLDNLEFNDVYREAWSFSFTSLQSKTFSNSIVNRIIFIGEIRQSDVPNTIPTGDSVLKALKSICYIHNILSGSLMAVLIMGAVLPFTVTSNSITAYADLPTERDPDIDVETVRLGKGSIPAGGIRILADLEPFFIIDGHVEFNAPANARDIKVIVAESTRKSITHAVILNPTKLRDIKTGESLFPCRPGRTNQWEESVDRRFRQGRQIQ